MMLILLIILTILASAFFSSGETAYLSVDRLQAELDKEKGKAIPKIQSFFFKRPGKYITMILVGNNIVNVLYGTLFAMALTPLLKNLLGSDLVVLILQTLISTAVVIIFGEYLPKMLARMRPNDFLRIESPALFFFYILLWPVTLFTNGLTWLALKVMGVKGTKSAVMPLGKVDLDYYIESNVTDEASVVSEARLLQNALDFSELKVRDCLVPRNEIAAVEQGDTIEDLIKLFTKTGFSKILVYNDTIDDIIGYIHSIEMFKCAADDSDWHTHIKQTVYIPESLPAEKVMKTLLSKKKNIAIVVDELGGTSGIVTLEDIVEEIFGEIEDEHDKDRLMLRQTDENEYIVSGRAEIDQINEKFDLNLPENDEYLTIAGYVLSVNQGIPKRGDIVSLPPNFEAHILRATGNKVTLIKLKRTED